MLGIDDPGLPNRKIDGVEEALDELAATAAREIRVCGTDQMVQGLALLLCCLLQARQQHGALMLELVHGQAEDEEQKGHGQRGEQEGLMPCQLPGVPCEHVPALPQRRLRNRGCRRRDAGRHGHRTTAVVKSEALGGPAVPNGQSGPALFQLVGADCFNCVNARVVALV